MREVVGPGHRNQPERIFFAETTELLYHTDMVSAESKIEPKPGPRWCQCRPWHVLVLVVLAASLCGWYAVNTRMASDYSTKWKAASVQQRGLMADPKLCHDHLKGKDEETVIAFLGEPNSRGSRDTFSYDLGTMGGDYQWTLSVVFDENGKVTRVFGDD